MTEALQQDLKNAFADYAIDNPSNKTSEQIRGEIYALHSIELIKPN